MKPTKKTIRKAIVNGYMIVLKDIIQYLPKSEQEKV
ncbi:unnamed protein product, partial [marine sediment metagenome]